MKSSRKRALKRKLRRFWYEWGVSKEDAEILLGGASVVAFPIVLVMLVSFFA